MTTKIYDSFLPPDNKIKAGPSGIPGKPPEGYKAITKVSPAVANVAKQLLTQTKEYGVMTPFEVDGVSYMARSEPHFHPLTGNITPHGWHFGITVYQKDKQTSLIGTTNSNGRLQLLEKIENFLNKLSE